MSTSTAIPAVTETQQKTLAWTSQDTAWMATLFGTAVGAGILFLPINAGLKGFWPVVVMVILSYPMAYLAHRGLTRFVMSSARPGSDLTEVVEEHFGKTAGLWITFFYFMAIYPFVLVYGVGLTNTINSFLVNQMGLAPIPRVILSFILVMGMTAVVVAGEKPMLKVCEVLVFPLVAVLLFVSLYLVPSWNLSSLALIPAPGDFTVTMWISLPVLIFAYSFTPAVSFFALAQERDHGPNAEAKAQQILIRASALLVIFTMGFVVSCVLSLSPQNMAEAKTQNLPILSYIANQRGGSFIAYLGPVVAFLAITTSYFGHFIGTREGLNGLITKLARNSGKTIDPKKLMLFSTVFIAVTTWIVATINPSILAIIESLGGPIVALILFIMPMYAVRTVPAMRRYSGQIGNVFIMVVGLLGLSAILYGLLF